MYTVVDSLTGMVMCVYTRKEDAPITLAKFKDGQDPIKESRQVND